MNPSSPRFDGKGPACCRSSSYDGGFPVEIDVPSCTWGVDADISPGGYLLLPVRWGLGDDERRKGGNELHQAERMS